MQNSRIDPRRECSQCSPKLMKKNRAPNPTARKCKHEKKFIRPFYALIFVRLLAKGMMFVVC
jgi:hypothetical protein